MTGLLSRCVPSSLRRRLKSQILNQLASAHRRRAGGASSAHTLVLPASSPGSLGDAAMILGLRRLLNEAQPLELSLFDYGAPGEWAGELGGRSAGVLPSTVGEYRRLAERSEIGRIFVNGADVLDGKYSIARSVQRLQIAEFVANCGYPATITGFSMRPDPPQEIVEAFQRLPKAVRLCARDPESHRRLQQITGREVVQVADLAFMLEPGIAGKYEMSLVEELKRFRGEQRRLVGICLNLHAVKLSPLNDEQRVEWLVECMAKMWRTLEAQCPDVVPVVLPHDYRGRWNDVALGDLLAERCGWTPRNAVLVRDRVSAPAIKEMCSHLDVLVTGRMHCGIAALGAGTPAIFFDYQGKVQGLLKLFGLSTSIECQADPQESASAILSQIHEIFSSQSTYCQTIRGALPTVRDLSRRNVESPAPGSAG